MREQIKGYVDAGKGALTPAGARELAKAIMAGASRERVQAFAQDLVERSARNRERVMGLVQREVAKQLKAVGVATKEDLDALRKRVRDLEKAAAASSSSRSSTTRPAAKKPAAKKSTAKRSTAAKRASSSSSSSSGSSGSGGDGS
jgi:hypothetical protein